jgi:hypothetical protein
MRLVEQSTFQNDVLLLRKKHVPAEPRNASIGAKIFSQAIDLIVDFNDIFQSSESIAKNAMD